MLTRYVCSHPAHLLGTKPPLSVKPSDAPGLMGRGFGFLDPAFQLDLHFSALDLFLDLWIEEFNV